MSAVVRRCAAALWHRLPDSWRRTVLDLRRSRGQRHRSRALWTRRVMDASVTATMAALPHRQLDAVEISGTAHARHPWRSHVNRAYPEFDVCAPFTDEPLCDVLTCEQVLEHVADPVQAVRSMAAMLRPGGTLIVSVPFLLRVHPHPEDYWRFTASGLRRLLETAGLEVRSVESWGNRRVVRANLRSWAPDRPWRSMRNDPSVPVVVWAVAARPGGAEPSPPADGATADLAGDRDG